ncbi:hypothetical protein EDC96DRAFT_580238 [Choanephora cucurbitarum]|nr:hypothetical protein EDC96DRAFT_580238 [Choanephora cucurbitarum]
MRLSVLAFLLTVSSLVAAVPLKRNANSCRQLLRAYDSDEKSDYNSRLERKLEHCEEVLDSTNEEDHGSDP